ncbi:hypothetical protein R3P38DRAFT_3449061 [Favolaschia claudopus]|uniref:Uncharacterized protein n=1 Tax=Favolaschia claudopus TaxID=2862362 RepID=A0AAW0CUK8_9AGAR
MQPYDPIDISHFNYETGSHVSTASVQRGDLNIVDLDEDEEPGIDFVFHCGVSKGAVLALPHGAHVEKLQNVENIRAYAMKYGASWYEYVNGPQLGRGIENGELFVVTGCEKVRSWGIASYYPSRQDFRLYYQRGTGAASNSFRWSGALGQKNPSQTKRYNPPPGDTQPLNHTTFVHGLSISIGKGIWNKLFGTVSVESSSFAHYLNHKGSFPSSSSASSSGASFFGNFFSGSGTSSRGRKHTSQQEDALLSDVPGGSRKVCNPSQLINEYILHKASQLPNATAVTSHDEDWSEILADTYQAEDPAGFLRKIDARFVIVEKDGESYDFIHRAFLSMITAIGFACLRAKAPRQLKRETLTRLLEKRKTEKLSSSIPAPQSADDYESDAVVENEPDSEPVPGPASFLLSSETPAERGRGRPKSTKNLSNAKSSAHASGSVTPRKRERPLKVLHHDHDSDPDEDGEDEPSPKRKRNSVPSSRVPADPIAPPRKRGRPPKKPVAPPASEDL